MKKILLRIIYVLIWITIIFAFVLFNLKSNSVYYAKNMPRGDGREPELVMLIDNLSWINTPNIDDIEYGFDGTRDITNKKSNRIFSNIYSKKVEYIYYHNREMIYSFNRKFDLIHITNVRKIESVSMEGVDKNKIVEEIKELVKPVIDRQTKPLINLQWIFNWIYEDEFK